MINILTAEMLSVEQLARNVPQPNMQQGRDDYAHGLVTIESVEGPAARIQVLDHRSRRPYQVALWLNTSQISMTCTCREGYYWYACRHRVAAFMALREHLKQHPPKIWKAVLDQGAHATTRRAAPNYSPVIFSLQERGGGWVVVPYTLAARLFAADELGDQEAVARAIEERGLSAQARGLRSPISRHAYPHAGENTIAAANLILGNPYATYGYGYGREGAYYETLLSFLPGTLVYLGEDGDPFQGRVEVLREPGVVEAALDQDAKGLRIKARIVADGQVLPLNRRETTVIVREPLWLLIDDTLVQVRAPGGLASALIEYPELTIPPEDQDEFFERHLMPLTESIEVRGDLVTWEQIDVEPVPRLYLGESSGDPSTASGRGLLAELRFGYGDYELPYDKRLSESSTRRRPGTTTLARIARRPEREQAAWQALSSYGLKRGPEPQIFVLRKTTQPVDFLLHQVPRLAEAGYTIFGEEALTSARVNRNRPTISFNVSSGIDWFDVRAVVNYGDLVVSLKDLRQAIRKREKYIKLADGTIGALPPEWVARYRHLLGLGEDHGETLRFSKSQITLLDQLLADADRARVDKEFERRRDKLRSFERIEPQALPQGFVGELRPYQKFGYDWLHFLKEYGFGGCLADDMGTGKCIMSISLVVVNGMPQTAESLWQSYAGETQFDGEGYWADSTDTLLVNAIDEQTGRIVQAPIRRLYRQQVSERLRTIKLEDGNSITITRQHRLLTSKGWTNDLHIGDYVCVPAKLPWDGQPVDPDLVTLLAWQISEGYEQQSRATVSITQNDIAHLNRLLQHLQCLAERYHFNINQPRVVTYPGKVPALVIRSKAYRHFLEAQGYEWGHLSRGKSIPPFIMQADLDSVRLFLRHYFEAEAGITRSRQYVDISTASPVLIQQLAILLRRFGIWLRISEKRKRATNGSGIYRTYYNGAISGNALRRFAQEIGFVSQRKQQLLDEVSAYERNTNTEGIPASELVAQAVTASKLPVRHFGMHNTVYLNGSQQFSRASLERVVAGFDRVLSGQTEQEYRQLKGSKWTLRTLGAYEGLERDALCATRDQLQHPLDQEVFYCRIKAIEDVEYEGWVYDFEVDKHHNFVANNIICHNTIQTLAFLQSLSERENGAPASLLVMPRSLLFNWQREAERFTPDLQLYVHADQGRSDDHEEFGAHDLVLTTYGTMLRDVELLRKYQFNYIILDESQAIKNPLAETSKAARLLRGAHRLVLTGTPVENTTLELWSQFAFLNPGLLGNLDYFREEFANPIERGQDGDTAQFLRKMVFPFILRRTKDQVAPELPPRTERVIVSDMEPAQRKLYDKRRDYYRALLLGLIDDDGMDDARMKILEGLLRLRQICNHPRLVDEKFKGPSGKFELLLDTLDTLRAEGHRALIFSQFVQMLSLVREALDGRGIPYAYLDGQTRDRQRVVDSFQNDDSLPFFLISLKAGGVGLNLTAADYVIHIDPWWNPAVEMQATDRTHRIGQDKPVFVYKLVVKDSVEEKILQLQEHKREIVEQVIGAEGGVFKSLTREDVEVLFT